MEPEIKDKIKEIIVLKCPHATVDEVDAALFDAEHEAIDYCHCNITEAMVYVVSKIACAMLNRNKEQAEALSSDEPKRVKSIKQGDTSIEFATTVIETDTDIIHRYRSDLNKFRKLVF